ncbi:hypothetical protein GUJ93_ZPchr0010g7225 [Zizania palustris]|uniref:CBM20 domain-containing protein n=1 Tax=Zizania palustris TaxID=103762 RepID=A0A8J5WAN7_ZIZPA|nr:hypothetical protein GUJ93_ZPchr0010g7225 [Zizania palustris]
MTARALGTPPPPPLGAMRAPRCPLAAADASTPLRGYRRGVAAPSSALSGHWGRHTLCSMQLMDALRGNLQVESSMLHSPKPLMSTRRDDSTITCKGFCKISWNLKADVLDGYLIFVTGDPVTLGCWESDMAVQLAPSVESSNIWTAEIKVPYGVNFKYNYFVREENDSSSDIVWRPGPEFSLSIPSVGWKKHVIVVKDLWMKTSVASIPSPSWGSWLMEASFLQDQIAESGEHQSIVKAYSVIDMVDQASSVGEHIILRLGNGTPLHAKHISENPSANVHDDFTVTDKPNAIKSSISQHERNQPVEEPWIIGSVVAAKMSFAAVKHDKNRWKFMNKKQELGQASENMPEQDQPVEEPWLFQSKVAPKKTVVRAKGKIEAKDIIRKLRKMDKPPAPLEDDKATKSTNGEPSSRVILINSSICTMQRIAVLEDGKLVELLLEPIKNNVQCDSIYLGIVMKLVPHMGGAFVDIGLSRPSLMSIKQNRDPFVFPQIVKDTKRDCAFFSDYNYESHPTYEEDDDMTDGEIADDENDDDSSAFPAEVASENEEGMAFLPNSKIKMIHSTEFESVSGYDEEKNDGTDDHMEDEYSEDILPDQSEVSNDLKTLSSIQHALRESSDDTNGSRWSHVRKGTKIMVQVIKEGLGSKGPTLSPFPCLRSRFWVC